MSSDPLFAHSLAEIRFYLRATPCTSCGKGPLTQQESVPETGSKTDCSVIVNASCDTCRFPHTLTFRISPPSISPGETEPPTVNPTDQPSRLLDVGQWITLFRVMLDSAEHQDDKPAARKLKLEAAQCLDEALKFYDEEDNDLPPVEAVFTNATRERLRKAPEQFSRRRLLGLRSQLPRPLKPSNP